MRKIPNPSDFKAAFCRRTYCNQKQIGGIFIAKLVVAEKPSVAMSYAKVLGATSRKDGYLEGNGYLVSWCVGHLVELAPPNVYDEKFIKWSIADLPILPQKWQYLVSTSTKKQFGIDKSRIQRFLGQTTRHEMRRIEEALMNSLEINEWDRRNANE